MQAGEGNTRRKRVRRRKRGGKWRRIEPESREGSSDVNASETPIVSAGDFARRDSISKLARLLDARTSASELTSRNIIQGA